MLTEKQLQLTEWTIQVNKGSSRDVCICFVMTELRAGETMTEVYFDRFLKKKIKDNAGRETNKATGGD